jgi:hypothetical protein
MGLVPVAVGMKDINLQVSASGEILRVSYFLGWLGARRRMNDARWEWVVEHTNYNSEHFFLWIVPRASYDKPAELRWTKREGLLLGEFQDGEYGDSGEEEIETTAMRKLGWPIANRPGTSILPGRDGWQRVAF